MTAAVVVLAVLLVGVAALAARYRRRARALEVAYRQQRWQLLHMSVRVAVLRSALRTAGSVR